MSQWRVWAYLCLNDTAKPTLPDGKEHMRSTRGPARINGDPDRAVCRVLEPCGHGERRDELAVHLRLGRACADGAPGDEVGGVLWRDGVEELAPGGEANIGNGRKEFARNAETFVDAEAGAEVGIAGAMPRRGRRTFRSCPDLRGGQ